MISSRPAFFGFALLFAIYQLPQGVNDYILPSRAVWLALTIVFFAAAYCVARSLSGRGLAVYGLQPSRSAVRNMATGVGLGVAASAGAGVVAYRLGLYRIDSVAPLGDIVVPAALLAFGSLLASVSEDILTRGYVWWRGGDRLGPASFGILSSSVFVLNHIYVLRRGPVMWLFLGALGFGLAWALHRTGSLWMTLGAHWGWNLVYHVSGVWLSTTRTADADLNTLVSAFAAGALSVLLVVACRSSRHRHG